MTTEAGPGACRRSGHAGSRSGYGEHPLPTPGVRPPGLQHCVRTGFCRAKAPVWGCLLQRPREAQTDPRQAAQSGMLLLAGRAGPGRIWGLFQELRRITFLPPGVVVL